MLHELQTWFAQDQPLFRQGDKKRTAILRLLFARRFDSVGIYIDKCDRRFFALKIRVAGRDDDDPALAREQLD